VTQIAAREDDVVEMHETGTGTGGADLETVARVVGRVRANVERVIEGKPDVVSAALVVLLAEGHLLIEDVPGVGKTMLSKSLARSIDCSVRRIQFTPDLLPSDVTGVSVFNQNTREFEFRPGGIFANIVVGDEINRASPKTQSALRMEVNDELAVLRRALPAALDAVRAGGRVVVESYHSLEDRLVKQTFTAVTRSEVPPDLPFVPEGMEPPFRAVTRGAEQATPQEIEDNPRAASVRLRAVERVEGDNS